MLLNMVETVLNAAELPSSFFKGPKPWVEDENY